MTPSEEHTQLSKTPPAPMYVLREQLLQLGPSQAAIARALGVSDARLSMLLNGRCGISPEMALRLGIVLNTPPDYWLKLQMQHDLSQAFQRHGRDLKKLKPLAGSPPIALVRR